MPAGRLVRHAAAVALVLGVVHLATSADPDPTKQRDEQRRIQARIDEASRQAKSTIDALKFQRLSLEEEDMVLEDVAGGLRKLSQDEVKVVLEHLDKAVKAPDPATASKEQLQAYEKHKQIVSRLEGLVTKLDAIKSLEDAAKRLDRDADRQVTLANGFPTARERTTSIRRADLAANEVGIREDLDGVTRGLDKLLPNLQKEQRDRVERALVMPRLKALGGEVEATVGAMKRDQPDYEYVADRASKHAQEMKALAAALRTTTSADRVQALKNARDKVEKAIASQEKVKDQTPDKARITDPVEAKQNKDLATAQAKAQFDARDAKAATEPVAPDAAMKVESAVQKEGQAEKEIREGNPKAAKQPQEKALDDLKQAKDDLDKKIAEAELAKKDPLAAVKDAAKRLDEIIKNQEAAKKTTEQAAKEPTNDKKLADAANEQKDVGKKTDDLRNTPLPQNPEAKAALDKAADAQKMADKDLAAKDPKAAKPDQQQALNELKKAKDALDKLAAAIEQRRDDIAKLEEAKKKLDELAKEERKVASDANKAADPNSPNKPDANKVADKQGELQPPTKDVGMQLKDVAPEAAKKVDEAGMKQEGAKQDLAKNMPTDGAQKATDAAKKLDEAAKAVDDKLAEKRGMEANDQQALNPNQVNPQAAMDQIQKAIDQANTAQQKADQAAKGLQPMPMTGMKQTQQPNLADLQKQIAKQAADQKNDAAAKAADNAAKALDKGDLPEAIKNQQKALDSLNQAKNAPMNGMPMDGMPKDGMGKDGMPTGGMPMTPGELAMQQQKVLDATQALQESQKANQNAQAALAQAQAQAPQSVQPQLQMANNNLQMANNNLQQGQPMQAGMNQQDAVKDLQQALDALNAAQAQKDGMGMQPGQGEMAMGMGMQPGMGMGQQPGMGMGMQPGMGQMGMGMQPGMGMGQQPGMGQQANKNPSEGDQNGGEKLKNGAVGGDLQTGDGAFIHLKKKERDKVQQNAEAQFPAEFRELIKQYNINIKNGSGPAAPAPTGGNR